jgi:glutamate--cysteine ligase
VSFEPGGQLELSPPPRPSASALVRQIAAVLDDLRCSAAERGVTFKTEGTNRWLTSDQIGLQKDTERYRKMQRHFDAIGPAGREMMRRTASLQVCLDLLPGRAGHEQWLLLNLCGPALADAFTNQPHLARLAEPTVESRSRIWQAVDASRSGFDGAQIGDLVGIDRVSAYRDFALRAEAIPLDEGQAEISPFRASLAQWIAMGSQRPTIGDLAHHLTTLFPPVRPRGRYLEVRYLDALPLPWVAVPLCLLTTLSYVPKARQAALEAMAADTRPLREQWRSSARSGLQESRTRTAVEALFTVAHAHLNDLPDGYLPPDAAALIEEYHDRFLQRGQTPADEDSSISAWRMPQEDKLCVLP